MVAVEDQADVARVGLGDEGTGVGDVVDEGVTLGGPEGLRPDVLQPEPQPVVGEDLGDQRQTSGVQAPVGGVVEGLVHGADPGADGGDPGGGEQLEGVGQRFEGGAELLGRGVQRDRETGHPPLQALRPHGVAVGGDGLEAAVGQEGAEVLGVGVHAPEAVREREIDGGGVVQGEPQRSGRQAGEHSRSLGAERREAVIWATSSTGWDGGVPRCVQAPPLGRTPRCAQRSGTASRSADAGTPHASGTRRARTASAGHTYSSSQRKPRSQVTPSTTRR